VHEPPRVVRVVTQEPHIVIQIRVSLVHVGVGVVEDRVQELPVPNVGEAKARGDGSEPAGVVLLRAHGIVACIVAQPSRNPQTQPHGNSRQMRNPARRIHIPKIKDHRLHHPDQGHMRQVDAPRGSTCECRIILVYFFTARADGLPEGVGLAVGADEVVGLAVGCVCVCVCVCVRKIFCGEQLHTYTYT
jgi:hypothetical protein